MPTEAFKASREILRDCPACRQSNPTSYPRIDARWRSTSTLRSSALRRALPPRRAGEDALGRLRWRQGHDERLPPPRGRRSVSFQVRRAHRGQEMETIAEAFRMEERIRRIMRINLEEFDGAGERVQRCRHPGSQRIGRP